MTTGVIRPPVAGLPAINRLASSPRSMVGKAARKPPTSQPASHFGWRFAASGLVAACEKAAYPFYCQPTGGYRQECTQKSFSKIILKKLFFSIYQCTTGAVNFMNPHHLSASKLFLLIPTALLYLSGAASAQESAYEDLNACTRSEQINSTAKGAGVGLITGLGAGLLSGKKDNAVKGAAIGAVVGGAAGFALAYYSAYDTCIKKNPNLIPESKIERTKNYEQVKKETKYKSSEGIKAQVRKIEMSTSTTPGVPVDINSTFIVLTPDGAETAVVIERKLFVVKEDGKEDSMTFTGKNHEERIVEAGEHVDKAKLLIPADMKAGTTLRVEFSVTAGNKPASSVSATVTVR
jgi:gas vesicle protein